MSAGIGIHVDPDNECKKSIGDNSVGVTIHIHDGLTTRTQQRFFEVTGWAELRKKIVSRSEDEPLISLSLQSRQTNTGMTYYFDKNGEELLGQISIIKKM